MKKQSTDEEELKLEAELSSEETEALDEAVTEPVELTAEEKLALLEKRAEEKIAELSDTLLRTQAEFENRRKRLLREKEDAVQFANASFAEDIIGLIDNLERAFGTVKDEEQNDFVSGMRLVEKDFLGVLQRKWGLERMDGIVGTAFDPERHEACLQEAADVETETVAQVLQSGYVFRGRVLRPAKVKVQIPN